MNAALVAIVFGVLAGCARHGDGIESGQSRLSQSQAVEIGLGAIESEMTKTYADKYEPYLAEFNNGAWHVFGTVPGGGPGGTPEAIVQDNDGKVLSVGHSQ